jgi:hypothetical protein
LIDYINFRERTIPPCDLALSTEFSFLKFIGIDHSIADKEKQSASKIWTNVDAGPVYNLLMLTFVLPQLAAK